MLIIVKKGMIFIKSLLSRISKIISSAIFTVLILLIIVILFYIFRVNYLTRTNRLGEVRVNFYTILTQSMYPTIQAGDIVITLKNMDNKYDNGDVITFVSNTNGGITITHRVNEAYFVNDSYSYKTKGDNNNTTDSEIVPGKNVLGKVIVKIPKAGFVQQFLVSRTGWIVAIVIPSLAIIINDILKLIRSLNKKNKSIANNDVTSEARRKLNETLRESDFSNDKKKKSGDNNG